MKVCEDNLSHIHMLVEEELEGQIAERLREHMSNCQGCSLRFEELERIKNLAEQTLSAELGPVDVTGAVRDRIAGPATAKSESRSFARWAWIPLAIAAAVVLLAATGRLFRHDPIGPGRVAARLTHVSFSGGKWDRNEIEIGKMANIPTQANERRSLRLENGVIVFLNEETALEAQSADLLRLLKGEIFVDTAGRKADTAGSGRALLRVRTDHATVLVSGTRFGVSADEKQTSVVVEKGEVKVESGWGEQVVAGGSIFRIIEGVRPKPPEPVDVGQTFSWVKERTYMAGIIVDLYEEDAENKVARHAVSRDEELPETGAVGIVRSEKGKSRESGRVIERATRRAIEPSRASSGDTRHEAEAQVFRRLSQQTVAFEFECEPFRDVLTFLNTITGVKLVADERIFEQLGEYEDCYGKTVDRREIFVTIHVSELPFESALEGMLRQHGLGYSIEDDHIYISFERGLPRPISRTSNVSAQIEMTEAIRRELSRRPVSFEFACEPLRDVIRFLSDITGILIHVDQEIFERLGEYEDCDGHAVDRADLFVTMHVAELPLESALDILLEQHDLVYSIESGYIYISPLHDLSERIPPERPVREKAKPGTEEGTRDALREPVAFGFECEPLHNVLRFFTSAVGVPFKVDENIYQERGADVDCYGKPVRRKEIFITHPASSQPLQSALNSVLRPHGLGFSFERDHLRVSTIEDMKERAAEKRRERAAETGWPQIVVKSIFDPIRSGSFIAIIEIDHRRRFVKAGERVGDLKILSIDDERGCLTVVKYGPTDEPEVREFCEAK